MNTSSLVTMPKLVLLMVKQSLVDGPITLMVNAKVRRVMEVGLVLAVKHVLGFLRHVGDMIHPVVLLLLIQTVPPWSAGIEDITEDHFRLGGDSRMKRALALRFMLSCNHLLEVSLMDGFYVQ